MGLCFLEVSIYYIYILTDGDEKSSVDGMHGAQSFDELEIETVIPTDDEVYIFEESGVVL